MLGNCATGKLTIVTAPTITIRIAITIATMGRLMKNLDMGLGSFQSNYESSAPSLVPSGSPPLLAFIRFQMALALRSCQVKEFAGPPRPHVHRASVRLG